MEVKCPHCITSQGTAQPFLITGDINTPLLVKVVFQISSLQNYYKITIALFILLSLEESH